VTTAADETPTSASERLLRIQEVAEETGLTPRSIRYYEELGLLRPAARSEGAYRLYDAADLEQLRFIKGLRDDAGLSLADIGQLLADEESRRRARAALKVTEDPAERRRILLERLASVEALHSRLTAKLARLRAIVEDVERRRGRLHDLLAAEPEEPAAGHEPIATTEPGSDR
jgi:DNA-binding transcriptional MerR regulator